MMLIAMIAAASGEQRTLLGRPIATTTTTTTNTRAPIRVEQSAINSSGGAGGGNQTDRCQRQQSELAPTAIDSLTTSINNCKNNNYNLIKHKNGKGNGKGKDTGTDTGLTKNSISSIDTVIACSSSSSIGNDTGDGQQDNNDATRNDETTRANMAGQCDHDDADADADADASDATASGQFKGNSGGGGGGTTKKNRTLKSLFIHFAGQHLNLFHHSHNNSQASSKSASTTFADTAAPAPANGPANGPANAASHLATPIKTPKKIVNNLGVVHHSAAAGITEHQLEAALASNQTTTAHTDIKYSNSTNLFIAFAQKYFNLSSSHATSGSASSSPNQQQQQQQQQQSRACHSCPVTPIKSQQQHHQQQQQQQQHLAANCYGKLTNGSTSTACSPSGACAGKQLQANGLIESAFVPASSVVGDLCKRSTNCANNNSNSNSNSSNTSEKPSTGGRPSVRFVEQAKGNNGSGEQSGAASGRKFLARHTKTPPASKQQVSLADCAVQTSAGAPAATSGTTDQQAGASTSRDEDRRLLSLLSASPFVDDDSARAKLVEQLFKLPPRDGATGTGSGPNKAISSEQQQQQQQQQQGTFEQPMSSGQFRDLGYKLIDYICNYLDTIRERRVTPINIEPGYLKSLIQAAAPERGEPFSAIMHDFENHIMCGITHWQHPHFHAYFPAGNAYPSILADMLSDALGCVGFSWAASPAYTELEIIMLDWMGKMIGLPDEFLCLSSSSSSTSSSSSSELSQGGATSSNGQAQLQQQAQQQAQQQQPSKGGGVIQGSASECVLVNLLAARHWAMEKLRKKYPGTPDGMLLSKLIGYCSKEAHSCVEKAAMIGFIRMRALDTDDKHSLRGETLRRAIELDQQAGLEPFIVCATLGTTSCVSFDNLKELGLVCQANDNLWLHVDAAYAGSALICPEFKYLIDGIELATSINMNPNKWMLINFDCSLMWVKDRFKLTRAFVVDPLYLQHSFSDQAIDYRHWGIPLSRRFRALKLWFVIRNYGLDGLRAYIRNHVRLAKLFAQLIGSDKRFSITNEVILGLVCFRLIGSNALNQRLLSMINASGKLHMVPASLNGRYIIRFCVCDQNAQDKDIHYAYECISATATELFELIRAGKERIRAISQQNTIDVSSISLHTQQSASADRLNGGNGNGGDDDDDERDDDEHQAKQKRQQVVAGTTATAPGKAAAAATNGSSSQMKHMLRRSSRHDEPLTGSGGADQSLGVAGGGGAGAGTASPLAVGQGTARSPLTKQASVVVLHNATAAAGAGAASGTNLSDLDGLEAAANREQQQQQQQQLEPAALESLATINGSDYDLDLDDDIDLDNTDFFHDNNHNNNDGDDYYDDEDDDQDDDDDDEVLVDGDEAAVAATTGQQQQQQRQVGGQLLKSATALTNDDSISPIERGRLSRLSGKSSRSYSRSTTTTTTSKAATTSNNQNSGNSNNNNDDDEAADELVKLIDKRNRMSLRYKREFFVRVVSDPRVYRASISGDINAHATPSTSSLGSSCQLDSGGVPAAAAAATTTTAQQPQVVTEPTSKSATTTTTTTGTSSSTGTHSAAIVATGTGSENLSPKSQVNDTSGSQQQQSSR